MSWPVQPPTPPPPHRTITTETKLLDVFGTLSAALGLLLMIVTSSVFVLVFGAALFVGGIVAITGAHVVTGLRQPW